MIFRTTGAIFPDSLKISPIKPIHKKDSKTDPNHYRPIAILPTSSKIFEKAICNRAIRFCEKFKILNESQHGFRKNRSTTLAVYNFIQEAINIIDNKEYAVGILLDLSKAYDKVKYNILIQKLNKIGFRGIVNKWFSSYLENRCQYVEIENYDEDNKVITNIRSECKSITAAIPQGSVLGCFLFLVYINDLPTIIQDHAVLFADDISILTSGQNSLDIHTKIISLLDSTNTWLQDHNLEINFHKTKIITFHPYQKEPLDINVNYNNINIETVNTFSLLGITLDTYINWKSHVQKTCSKLSKFSYALRQIKNSTNFETALSMYYAFAQAWLNYGIILWGNSTDILSVFTLQKRLIRILVHIEETDSCKPYFIKNNILTLTSIYILETCKFVRKYPTFFKTRNEIPHKYTLRNRNNIIIPQSQLKIHLTSPLKMSIKIYNKIPDYIKRYTKDKTFIDQIKNILVKKAYYTLQEFLDDKHFY